jgi:hypothetical protein
MTLGGNAPMSHESQLKRPPLKLPGKQTGRRRFGGELLDIAGGAELLGIFEKTLRGRISRGTIPYRRWGGRVILIRAELMKFFQELPGISPEQASSNIGQRMV